MVYHLDGAWVPNFARRDQFQEGLTECLLQFKEDVHDKFSWVFVASGVSINVAFPNQFQIGNPENEPGKFEIYFDNLLVESLQKSRADKSRRKRKRNNADGDRKKMEHQKIINQIKAMVNLMRKQDSIHKKVMKLLREMINIHNHVF